MPSIPKPRILQFTHHAHEKMAFYRLSEQRVKRVINAPKRIEEGVAPKTVAMMAPSSTKRIGPQGGAVQKETWTQEIWVMVQDVAGARKVISAWRYPGVTKPRDDISQQMLRGEYEAYSENDTIAGK